MRPHHLCPWCHPLNNWSHFITHPAAAITKWKKLPSVCGCQILNGDVKCHHWKVKMKSPTSLNWTFWAKMQFFGWNDQKMRVGIWRQVAFYPVYLPTYYRYFNSEECILILIEFPLIWYIVGLCRSKLDPVFKCLKEWEALDEKVDKTKTRMWAMVEF